MFKKGFFYVTIFLLVFLAGCTTDDISTEIVIDTSLYEMRVGNTGQLDVEVTTTLEGYTIVYSSLNPNVATVNQNGQITAVREGSTNITVEVGDQSENVLVVVSVVPDPEPDPEPDPVIPVINAVNSEFSPLVVAFNTELELLTEQLPATIELRDDQSNVYERSLTWTIEEYDADQSPTAESTYTAVGTFDIPNGVESSIETTVELQVTVEADTASQALTQINLAPNTATLETFETAGIRNVNANNIDALIANLIVAKNTTYNPEWDLETVQSVLDLIIYNGITWNINFNLENDGQINSVELVSSSDNLEFKRSNIKPSLLEFFTLNRDLLENQEATFQIAMDDDVQLTRVNYLRISNDTRFNQDIIVIPSHSNFDNLTIDGRDENFFVDILVGANNVTLKNLNHVSVIAHSNAKVLNLDNVSLLNGSFVNDIEVNASNVTLENSMSFNPYKSVNYDNFENSTLMYELSYSDFALLLPLLNQSATDFVGTPLGFIFNTYLIGNDLYGDPLSSENRSQLLANQQFENINEITVYLNNLVDTYESVINDSNDFFDETIIDELYLVPTVNSMLIARNHLLTTIESRYGSEALERLRYMARQIEPSAYLFELNQNINSLPNVQINGTITIHEEAHLIGRFEDVALSTAESSANLHLYQGSYLEGFDFGNNIEILLEDKTYTNPFTERSFTYTLEEFSSYIDASEVILENGSFQENINDSGSTTLVLLGDITGVNSDIQSNIDAIYIGLTPAFNIDVSVMNTRFDHPGETNLTSLDVNNDTITVYGPNNEIAASDIQDLAVRNNPINDPGLTLQNVDIDSNKTITVNGARMAWDGLTLSGNLTVELNGVLDIISELPVPNSSDLTINDAGSISTVNNIENINFESFGIPIVGNTLDVNLKGDAFSYQWVYVTESGILNNFNGETSDSLVLQSSMIDWTPSIEITNNSQRVVGEFTTIDADIWNASQSFITYETDETSVTAAASNVEFEINLRTKNGYRLETSQVYNFQLRDGSTTWYNVTQSMVSIKDIPVSITEAKIYSNLELYVNQTKADVSPEFLILPSTPVAIAYTSPTTLPRMGASTDLEITVRVSDVYGNGVADVPVTFSSIGTVLDVDQNTRFDELLLETEANGSVTNVLRVDPVALTRENAFDVFAAIENVTASFLNVDIVQNIGDTSELLGDRDLVVSAGALFTVPLALNDTKGIPQPVTDAGVSILLIDGELDTGTVVATLTSSAFTNTTTAAMFSITEAGVYALNVFVETYQGSGEFLLVDDINTRVVPLGPSKIVGVLDDNSTTEFPVLGVTAFAFTVSDIYDNPIENAIVEIVLSNQTSGDTVFDIGSISLTSSSIETDDNGQFELTLNVAADESFSNSPIELALSISGTSVDLTNNFAIINRVSEVHTTFEEEALDETFVADTENLSFEVYLRNPLEEAISGGDYAVQLTFTNGSSIQGTLTGIGLTRTALFSLTNTSLPLQDATLSIEEYVGAGEYLEIDDNLDIELVSNTLSSITVSYSFSLATNMRVDTGERYTFTVEATDEFGNPIMDYAIDISLMNRLSPTTEIVGGDSEVQTLVDTDANGQVIFDIEIGDNEPIGNVLTLAISGVDDFDAQSIELYNGFEIIPVS